MISPLKQRSRLLTASLLLAFSPGALAQNQPGSTTAEPMPVDSRISAALKQVSAERIRANIEKLATFGTRSTISAQDPAAMTSGRGIGAAREWISRNSSATRKIAAAAWK